MIILASVLETIPMFFLLWLWHLVPASVAVLFWFLWRKRVCWYRWEFTLLVMPFWVWVFLILLFTGDKGFGNLFVESMVIGCALPLAPVARLILKLYTNTSNKMIAVEVYSAVLVMCVGLWLLVPGFGDN